MPMMKVAVAALLVAAVPLAALAQPMPKPKPDRQGGAPAEAVPAGEGGTFSVGDVQGTYPAGFTAAANAEEVTAQAVIPPCDPDFGVCLFYSADTYAGTNFESAGLRILVRDDLAAEEACLTTQPDGYSGLTADTTEGDGYTVAHFSGLGDAGAGHYASGDLYRLYAGDACTEFETRIGATQFGNYTPGAIQEFTDADQAAIKTDFQAILDSVHVGETAVTFPPQA